MDDEGPDLITENEVPGWDLLAEVALARRNRLGLTQRNIAELGGPSAPTVRALETQSSTMTPRSLRKLEAALGWALGTSRSLIEGLEPESQDEWSDCVFKCIHDPPLPPNREFTNALDSDEVIETPIIPPPKQEFVENQYSESRTRYEQLDISLSHATYLLSQIKSSQEDGNDSAFQDNWTSLHHLIRSMHYSVMQELT